MSFTDIPTTTPELDVPLNDLGPLAWVLEEMRKAMASATRALRRFAQETRGLAPFELAAYDASQLRIARQHLHQAAGAAEMVGQAAPASLLSAMEAATLYFAQHPGRCTDEAASRIERAGFGLMQYFEGVLTGKATSAVALFPQYRDVQALVGNDRVHPADLWSVHWAWQDPDMPQMFAPLGYDTQAKAHFEQAILQCIKSQDAEAARFLRDLSLGFAQAQTARQPMVFWKLCAGFFEANALGLCAKDVHVKRATSRILQQFSALVRGELGVPDRLAQDILFFCAQARPAAEMTAPVLNAVRRAYGVANWVPVDYERSPFGAFDPALLVQARKRIAAVKEAWSSVAGNDLGRLRGLVDQFSLVSDSLIKLHPQSGTLAVCLRQAADATARSGAAPSPALAMEVATAVMFLEAAFEELDPNDQQLGKRTARLAQRLQRVQSGGQAEPLEPWIEELYRRVSDRQTMGSVVGELRGSLDEIERTLDQYFREPLELPLLTGVPSQLAQMRGVLSVLGLDHAVRAVLRMRQTVEDLMASRIDMSPDSASQVFSGLGNNLGALGLLFDMLSYQPVLAKKLFVFNEIVGELQPLMGRMSATGLVKPLATEAPPITRIPTVSPSAPTPKQPAAAAPVPAPTPVAAALVEPEDSDEDGFQATNFAPDSMLADTAFASISLGLPEAGPSTLAPLDLPSDLLDLPPTYVYGNEQAPAVPAATPAIVQLVINRPAPPPIPQTAAVRDESKHGLTEEETELQGIFLDEAREVVDTGKTAVAVLDGEPSNLDQMTALRRAFHTLKGSSRMVGLSLFGEAAWAMEQVLNTWLADRKPATLELRTLSDQALSAFEQWTQDIAAGSAEQWTPRPFQVSADALRLDNRFVPLNWADFAFGVATSPEVQPEPAVEPHFEIATTDMAPSLALEVPVAAAVDTPGSEEQALVVDTSTEPDFNFDEAGELTPEELARQFFVEEVEASPVDGSAGGTEFPEIEAVDIAALEAAVGPVLEPVSALPAQEESEELALDLHALEKALGAEVAAMPVSNETQAPDEMLASPFDLDETEEQTKVIGDLRIDIPLYNVYLNEADEWSRQLQTELGEWTLERHRRLGDSTIGLAHSLAGSSATVGFVALSDMARMLEHAMQWVQALPAGTPEQADVFNDTAEDIRRLLHQFAAGFLKEPKPEILRRLHALLEGQGTLDPVQARAVPASLPAASPVPSPPVLAPVAIEVDESSDEEGEFEGEDSLDPELFALFEEEALDLLPQLGGALRQWVARPDNVSARAETLRVLHTLKGSARLAGANRLGERTHRMESAIERLGARGFDAREAVPGGRLEALLGRFDTLQASFDSLRSRFAQINDPAHRASLSAMADMMHTRSAASIDPVNEHPGVLLGQSVATPEPEDASAANPLLAAPPPDQPIADAEPQETPAPQVAAASTVSASPTVHGALRQPGQAVRIRSQLLDKLVNQTGEVMMTRARLEAGVGQMRSSLSDLTDNLDRLRKQLRDVELQAELQMQSRMAQTKDVDRGFDPLEFDRFTRVQELTRMMAESVNDVATVQRSLLRTVDTAEADLIAQGRQTRELQRDLLRTRMVEFETVVERLYRVVRQAAKECGKQVKLDITGGSIEMDRGVLDRMTPAFEHLLRNAVAHGIEAPAAREAAGKPAIGAISIVLSQEGNDVSVSFADDGAGLDPHRIHDKALKMGLVQQGQVLTPDDMIRLVFLPGFTTVAQVTELAGRGIGMDVVRSEVLALGGRIESETTVGRGTQFKLVLPLTTAVTQVVMVRSGRLAFGVPANLVELVRRINSPELADMYSAGSYTFGSEKLPFFWSGSLLQIPGVSEDQGTQSGTVIILRSAQQRVALHVDEVLGNQEVVVKNLGPQLSGMPGLSGMTVLASGAVVLIYNPVALAAVYGDQVQQFQKTQVAAAGSFGRVPTTKTESQQAGVPLVLVVDDSITVRRVTQRLLQREGYRVALAVDGVQALERLREELPVVVLSDIEMPRMDGFELTRTIRGSEDWKALPIITITSRMAEKHREHARELGVNHYLGKPYSEEELLGLIRRYVREAAGA
jgi:chemosensory pili system protein ChpA (sensor histidine kinase/response regulator)